MEKTLDRLITALEAKGYKKHGRATRVAEAAGYSVGMVSDVLRGKADLSVRFLDTVCGKVGISKQWVLTGEGDMLEAGNPPSGVQESRIEYQQLPEPIEKAIEVLRNNPDRAWELYALILERVEKKK